MTPAAIRMIANLRQEFYSLFAAEMSTPVRITNRNSSAGNFSIASWADRRQQLNYLCIFAHTAPDDLVPDRPLVLRLTVNKGGDMVALAKQRKSGQGLNRGWNFELTLLPEEMLDFLPWLINLIESYDTGASPCFVEAPHPLDFKSTTPSSHNTRTQTASRKLLQECVPAL